MRLIGLGCAVLLWGTGAVLAQQAPPPAAAEPPPAAMAPAPSGGAAADSKKAACQATGRAQGLKGHDMADEVQLCVLEARVDCLKQAIAAKRYGPDRQAFMKGCIGGE